MTAAPTRNEDSPSENVGSPTCYIARIVKQSGSSFYWAMRVLDPDRRQALYAIYAFCRAVDDIADGDAVAVSKLQSLKQWRQEIDLIYQGDARTLIGQSLQHVVPRYNLSRDDFLAVIDGMESDAQATVRIPDETALVAYIDRVACAVGRLCTPVFGMPGDQGGALAKALGEALQLTNILRDLEEDAARDRLYLPFNRLKSLDIHAETATSVLADPACVELFDDLSRQALERYAEAETILNRMDRQSRRAPRLMMAAYRRILEKIIAHGWRMPRSRSSLSRLEKVWIVLRYGWF